MLPKVYVETSVVSYLTAWPSQKPIMAAHQAVTKDWWQSCRTRFEVFASDAVVNEASDGDATAAQERLDVLATIDLLPTTDAAIELAKRLVAEGAIPPNVPEDALHVAIAAVHHMDYLLTWNFRHLNNMRKVAAIETVCLKAGYQPPKICSPEQLMEDDHDS